MYKSILALIMIVTLGAAEIATVDMTGIFDKYYKTLRADKKLSDHQRYLDEQFKYKLNKRQELEKQLQKLTLDATSLILTETMKREKSRELERRKDDFKELTQELQNFQKTAREQLQKTIREGRIDILKNIQGVIDAYAKSNNFDVVLDSSSNINEGNLSRVIFFKKSTDITAKILIILNDSHEEEVLLLKKEKEARLAKLRQLQNAESRK